LFREAAAVLVHFREEAAGSRAQGDDFRALGVDSPVEAADFHAPVADSLERADDSRAQAVDFPLPGVDFLELVAASSPVEALACSQGVRWFASAADSRAQAAGSLERVGEPGVALLVLAADFLAAQAASAGSEGVHSLVRGADFRESAVPSGSQELARSRALAVDFRVPLVSQVVLRSAYSAALPAAFLLRAAVDDWLAVLLLCWRVALEQASHSP
jgi:hypothetical protein